MSIGDFCGFCVSGQLPAGSVDLLTTATSDEMQQVITNLLKNNMGQLTGKDLADLSKLPKVEFTNFDQVLQQKLYQFCFPMIRKNVYLSSKRFRGLGQMPKTFLSMNMFFPAFNDRLRKIQLEENIVIVSIGSVAAYHLKNNDFRKMTRIVDFRTNYLDIQHSQVSPQILRRFANPGLSFAHFRDCKVDFVDVLKLMPDLKSWSFNSKLPNNWESELLNANQKFTFLIIYPEKITNFKVLGDFIARQSSNFELQIKNCNVEFVEVDLFNFFQKVDGKVEKPKMKLKSMFFCSKNLINF